MILVVFIGSLNTKRKGGGGGTIKCKFIKCCDRMLMPTEHNGIFNIIRV